MKLILCLVSLVLLGACASSPQQRRESFHKMVHSTQGKKIIVNRLDEPNTCWSETAPPSQHATYLYREVACDPHASVLSDP